MHEARHKISVEVHYNKESLGKSFVQGYVNVYTIQILD